MKLIFSNTEYLVLSGTAGDNGSQIHDFPRMEYWVFNQISEPFKCGWGINIFLIERTENAGFYYPTKSKKLSNENIQFLPPVRFELLVPHLTTWKGIGLGFRVFFFWLILFYLFFLGLSLLYKIILSFHHSL